jgi:excinuclease ABC subunit A
LIDLGPEGGDEGGQLIATGTPEQVAQTPDSHTGSFLSEVLPIRAKRTTKPPTKSASNGSEPATKQTANGSKPRRRRATTAAR